MPIAILTDLFLLEHERTTCDNNHYSKYKEDLKQSEEHNKINEYNKRNDNIQDKKLNEDNENKCCRKCKFF